MNRFSILLAVLLVLVLLISGQALPTACAQSPIDKSLLVFKEERISISVSEVKEDAVASSYVLSVKAPVDAKYHAFILREPVRLVLDIWGLQISKNKVFSFADHPILQALRIANDGQKVRLVMDWKEASLPFWETRYADGSVQLVLRASGIAIPPTPAGEAIAQTETEPAPAVIVETTATPTPEPEPAQALEPSPAPTAEPEPTEVVEPDATAIVEVEVEPSATATPEAEEPPPSPTDIVTTASDVEKTGILTTPGLELATTESAEVVLAIASPQALTPAPIVPVEVAPASTQLQSEQPGMLAPLPVTMMPLPGAVALPGKRTPMILSVRRSDGSIDKNREISEIVLPGGMPSAEELLKFSVDRVFVPFRADRRPIEDITVKNKTDKPLYITAQAQRLMRPGFGDQSLHETLELLASPKRFQLEPNGTRTIRMVLQKPAVDEEMIYRVTFLPQLDSFEKTLLQGEIKGKPANIGVVAGLAVTVSAQPADTQPQLEWMPSDSGGAIISNTGKVSVVLESGKFCPARGGNCTAVPGKRLYPGNNWRLETPKAGTLEFLKKFGNEFEPMIIKLNGPVK